MTTYHGKVLEQLTRPVSRLKCVDLGCGNRGAGIFFDDYTGMDLPEFNVYVDRLTFLAEYEVVLMNAFIDVMQFPLLVMEDVMEHARKYVIIHRQELTAGETEVTQEPAYGGWTYHSRINEDEFLFACRDFEILKRKKLNFDNWEGGGASFLLKKK